MVLKIRFQYFTLICILLVSCSTIKVTNRIDEPYLQNDITENVLFYIAHQDDEVFILSKIKEHLNSEDNVFIIYTCLSYQNGEGYKEKRINESKRALESINIKPQNVFYLGFPDGNSHKHLKSLIQKTDSLLSIISPNIIYTSAYEGGNIDHDIANFVIGYLNKNDNHTYIAFEFPEYSGYKTILTFKLRSFPQYPETYIRKLSKKKYKEVLEYWKNYKSQKFPFGFYMSVTTGKKVAFGYEYHRKLPNHNYLEKPPTLKIAYEKYLKAEFMDFKNEIEKIIPRR